MSLTQWMLTVCRFRPAAECFPGLFEKLHVINLRMFYPSLLFNVIPAKREFDVLPDMSRVLDVDLHGNEVKK